MIDRLNVVHVILPTALQRQLELDPIELEADDVRQLLQKLPRAYPQLEGKLIEQGELRPGLSIAINGTMAGRDYFATLPVGCEVRFVPAISGG